MGNIGKLMLFKMRKLKNGIFLRTIFILSLNTYYVDNFFLNKNVTHNNSVIF